MNTITIIRLLVMLNVAVVVFITFMYIDRKKLIKNGLINMYGKINSSAAKRKMSEMEIRQMYGNYSHRGLVSHIDENIRYSGMQLKYRWLTTELYVVVITTVLVILFLLVSVAGGEIINGVVSVVAMILAIELYFNSLRRSRYNRVEDELLPFINSIDAYAGTTDDIITIFEKSVPVLTGPLKEAVYSAVFRSKQTGNCSEVLRNLEDSIEHPFFKKLIRNLEISSRHSANYKDIITECRYQLDEAAGNAKKLEKIYRDGKFNIVVVVICGIICVLLALVGILDYAVEGFFIEMWGTVLGKIILIMCAAALLISFYIAFIASQRRGHE